MAQVSPAVPGASLFNSVTYRDAARWGRAARARDRIRRGWGTGLGGVDTRERRCRRPRSCVARASALDSSPEGMGCRLQELVAPEGADGLQYTDVPERRGAAGRPRARLRHAVETCRRAVADVPNGTDTFVGLAHLDGVARCRRCRLRSPARTRACTASPPSPTLGVVGSLGACSTSCCSARLSWARKTTTLQASGAGRGVYAALGYRSFGPMNLWERREP